MKQITIKEIKELAHMADNNHIATVIANYYFGEAQRLTQEGHPYAGNYYHNLWSRLVRKLDELEDEEN